MSDDEIVESDYDQDYDGMDEEKNPIDSESDVDSDVESDDDNGPNISKPKPDDDSSIIYIVSLENQKTYRRLSLAECTQIIGRRIALLDAGCPPYVDISGLTNSRSIALKELYERRLPLCINRKVEKNVVERIPVRILALPPRFAENNPI